MTRTTRMPDSCSSPTLSPSAWRSYQTMPVRAPSSGSEKTIGSLSLVGSPSPSGSTSAPSWDRSDTRLPAGLVPEAEAWFSNGPTSPLDDTITSTVTVPVAPTTSSSVPSSRAESAPPSQLGLTVRSAEEIPVTSNSTGSANTTERSSTACTPLKTMSPVFSTVMSNVSPKVPSNRSTGSPTSDLDTPIDGASINVTASVRPRRARRRRPRCRRCRLRHHRDRCRQSSRR